MYNAAILAQENASSRHANEKKRQKSIRSNQPIAHKGGLTIGEGLQLAQQPGQPVEESQVVSHEAGESANQAGLARKCGQLGHKINRCNMH